VGSGGAADQAGGVREFLLENDLAGRGGQEVLLLGWNAQTVPGEQDVMGQDGPQAPGEAALLRQVRKFTTGVLERGWPGES
jgi:hypothetical protein